jgi:hypothetical protein
VIGLGCAEVVILAVIALAGFAIVMRVVRRRRQTEQSPEDDAGW